MLVFCFLIGFIEIISAFVLFFMGIIYQQYICFLYMFLSIISCMLWFKFGTMIYTQKQQKKEIEELRMNLNECRQLLNLPLLEKNEAFVELPEEDIDKNSPDYFDENSPDFEDAFLLDEEDTNNTPPPSDEE